MVSSLLNQLHQRLQWPKPDIVANPPGAGPAVYSRLARLKIEKPLARRLGDDQVCVSVLVGDPFNDSADPPIALLCEFTNALTPDNLNETRKLAWNFCRSPILITMEPHLIRVWSCYEQPDTQSGKFPAEAIVTEGDGRSLNLDSLVDTLHWIYLASGQFLARHRDRFDRNQRADTTLLKNLQYVREKLTLDLPEDIAHDLLARIIFVQFLFHRRDTKGNAALNAAKLQALQEERILSHSYQDLPSILRHKSDTFALFKWLNTRFNGDLFPSSYTREQRLVTKTHMNVLADFVSGKLQLERGQHLLWPHYSFDTIPLEFISSIYEEFVTERKDGEDGIGEHYTRPFLVDFILDKILPWSGNKYDLKILDPCCGSAVFLVKAFQRLVQRWRNANPDSEPKASFLRKLLEENICGVDINPDAIRVSSFSLYLAMCDEIDPKHYWTQVRFPNLREVRLKTTDFFAEDVPGFSTANDKNRYDLILGNAPWGKKSLTEKAREWAKDNGWKPVGEQAGTLFLAKAAKLCRSTGHICMIQPAGSLLFNISPTALDFRKKFFTTYKVNEVVNLSALRFLKIFPSAVGPACIIRMRPNSPNTEPIAYWSPTQTNADEQQYRVVIDAQDLNWVWPEEAANEPTVWPALMWGGRRDFEAVTSIGNSTMTLCEAKESSVWRSTSGFKRVPKNAERFPKRVGVPILEHHDLFDDVPLVTNVSSFPENKNPMFERKRLLKSFALPRLLLRTSWKMAKQRRFKAIVVHPDTQHQHLLYSQSFFGIETPAFASLAAMAISLNSSFAVYYLYMTSGRLSSYRPTIRKSDLEKIPIPRQGISNAEQLLSGTTPEIDAVSYEINGLNEIDIALVEDFFEITLRDFKGSGDQIAPGTKAALVLDNRSKNLDLYCEWFLSVLKSGFGENRDISATVFAPDSEINFPYCVIAIHLDWSRKEQITYERLAREDLFVKLADLEHIMQLQDKCHEAIYYRRVSRIYQTIQIDDNGTERQVPTVFLIKPNQLRYWTRSIALRDADEVAADLFQWSALNMPKRERSPHA